MSNVDEPVTFDSAVAKAAELLGEAGRGTASSEMINAKVAVADRWLQLAALIGSGPKPPPARRP